MRQKAFTTEQHQRKLQSLLRRLHWTVLRPLASRLGGEERSLFRGPGLEFDELREYQPGDDVRAIDWNVTARQGTAFVRQSFVQRALDIWIVLDLSASVDWGTAQCLKRDRALEFIAVAGQIFEHGRHHLGALFFAERPLGFVPPAAGHNHLLRMLDLLAQEPRQARPGKTNLKAAITRLETVIRRPSLVLLVSDFLVQSGWQPALGRLNHRHEVIGIRLVDPREGELPDAGLLTLEDPETGRQLIVDTGDAGLRERYRAAAGRQAERIRSSFTTRGIDFFAISTGEDLLPAMVRFLEDRRRRGRLSTRAGPAQRGLPV